ncbi:MAG: Ig domain-containing protein [Planctomycetota bacterium]
MGVAYSQTLAATGGATPYTWSVIAGVLPDGLGLNGATGEISGTATAYGTFAFTVQVDDSWVPADTATQALSITVIPAPLVITTATLPDGQVGAAYSQTRHYTLHLVGHSRRSARRTGSQRRDGRNIRDGDGLRYV